MVNPTGQCTKAAQSIALEVHPKEDVKATERAKARERAALQKDLAGKCNNYFNPKSYAADKIPDDVRTVRAAVSATSDIVAAITNRVKAFAEGTTTTPGSGPANADAVGQTLNQAMKQLLDSGKAPVYAFGNFQPGRDPITLPSGAPAAIDYDTEDATGSVTHKDTGNIVAVTQFLQAAQKTATPAWIAEAEKGAPAGSKPGSDAWLALQHLRAFAKNVTNLPAPIKAEVDALGKVAGFNAGPGSGRCGDGTVTAPETCDDGSDNGKPGKCKTTCDGTVSTDAYEPKDVELSVGAVMGLGGDCFNPIDDKASGAVTQRCMIPGTTDEGNSVGWLAGVRGGVKLRLLDWGAPGNAGGLSLGVEFMHLWQQDIEAIDLPDSASAKARTDITTLTTGQFDVKRFAAMVTLGFSWVDDQVELTGMGGLARSWYTGRGGTIFTGWINVTAEGTIPNADALSISPYGGALGLRIAYKPKFTGDLFRLRFGLGAYGMIHSKEQSTVRFPTRTVEMNPDIFMGLLTIDGTFNFGRF